MCFPTVGSCDTVQTIPMTAADGGNHSPDQTQATIAKISSVMHRLQNLSRTWLALLFRALLLHAAGTHSICSRKGEFLLIRISAVGIAVLLL